MYVYEAEGRLCREERTDKALEARATAPQGSPVKPSQSQG